MSRRKELPVYRHKDEILSKVRKFPIVLVVGETGSGKTTQIPQYLLDSGEYTRTRGRIVCTQPRTVAATSVAKHVASEQGCRVGEKVGYQVRLDVKMDQCQKRTELIYMTEGSLLRKAMCEERPHLSEFSVVLVDEAHERTVNADLLMGFLKDTVKKRKDLRVIIMSATLDVERFKVYFENPPLISIPGNLNPITRYFLNKPISDYLDEVVKIVTAIHAGDEAGDILVFLTGAQEIDEAVDRIRESSRNSDPLDVFPLYAQMSSDNQMKAFMQTSVRKCVVATNIAETSLTINGIVFVIDCGYSKQKLYHPGKAVEALGIRPISKASVKQRVGRAGRTAPGKAYHLYTYDGYCQLPQETQAEIMRSSLINETLSMLALGIKNPLKFDYIDPPSEMTLARALNTLYHLGAVDDCGSITEIGKRMARFPVDPRLAKAILKSIEYNVVCEVVTIAAMLETKDKLFFRDRKSSEHKTRRKKYSHIDGDHLTLLNVFNAYMQKKSSESARDALPQFCKENYWDMRCLQRATRIRGQLERVLEQIHVGTIYQTQPTHKDYYPSILKSLLCGYFLNVAVQGYGGKYWIFRVVELNERHKAIEFLDQATPHPSSVYHKGPKRNWIMYHEVVIQQVTHLRCLSAIKPSWLLEVAPKYFDVRAFAKDKSPVATILRNIQN